MKEYKQKSLKELFFKPINLIIIFTAIALAFSITVHWVIPILVLVLLPGFFIFYKLPQIGIFSALYGVVLLRGLLFVASIDRTLPAFVAISLIVITAAFLIRIKGNIKGITMPDTGDLIFFIIVLMFVLNCFRSHDFSYGTFKTGIFMMTSFLPYMAIYFIRQDRKPFFKAHESVLMLGAFLLTIAVFDFAIRGVGVQERFSIGGIGPIGFARSMGIIIISALVVIDKKTSSLSSGIASVILVLAMFFLILSATRGPFLSILGTTLIYLIFMSNLKVFHKAIIIIVFIGVILLVIKSGFGFMVQRFSSIETGEEISVTSRFFIWKETFNRLLDYPILGYGTGGFTVILGASFKAWKIIYPHNIFMEFGIEHGVIGLTLLFILLGYSTFVAIWLVRSPLSKDVRSLALFAILLTLYGLSSAMVSSHIGGYKSFWIGQGLLFTAKQFAETDLKEKKQSTND